MGDELNWYAYVMGNPVMFGDPWGWAKRCRTDCGNGGSGSSVEERQAALGVIGVGLGAAGSAIATGGASVLVGAVIGLVFVFAGLSIEDPTYLVESNIVWH